MKTSKILVLSLVTVTAFALSYPVMANSGMIKTTIASDTPYQKASTAPDVTASGITFQIAPIKTAPVNANSNFESATYHQNLTAHR